MSGRWWWWWGDQARGKSRRGGDLSCLPVLSSWPGAPPKALSLLNLPVIKFSPQEFRPHRARVW